jgi:hypothetical protein
MEDDKQLSSWPSCGLLNSSVTASSDRHYLRHELGLAAGHTLFEVRMLTSNIIVIFKSVPIILRQYNDY